MGEFLSKLKGLLRFGGAIHIGIDVGASSVKIIAVKNNRSDRPKVVGAAIVEIPVGCVVDGVLNDTRSVSEIIRNTLESARIDYHDQPAAVGMRGLNVVYKKLLLPFQKPAEMAQQIWIEAQQQVDSDLTSWIIDHQVMAAPDIQGQVPVMLVAAKRSAVEEFNAMLQLIGVKPDVFDCDVFAIENAAEQSMGIKSDTIMCLDIGQDSTKINIIQDGHPCLTRSFSLGGSHLTELMAKNLGIDFSQAETMKISANSSGDLLSQKEVAQSVKVHIEEINEEIKRTLEFFANSSSDVQLDTVDRVILSGGGATVAGLPESISKFLNCQVDLARPFERANVTAKAAEVINMFPHVFNVAYGLALRYAGDKPH